MPIDRNADKISQTRVNFDKFIDYVPLASAINSAVDLIQKAVFKRKAHSGKDLSHYQQYINNKEVKDCLLYILPFAKVIDKIKDKITTKIEKFADQYGVRSRAPAGRLEGETEKEFYERITLDELNKTRPIDNIQNFLLERMKVSSKTYNQIAHSKYQDWKFNLEFLMNASKIYQEQYLVKGNDEDRDNFLDFLMVLPEKVQNRMVRVVDSETSSTGSSSEEQ